MKLHVVKSINKCQHAYWQTINKTTVIWWEVPGNIVKLNLKHRWENWVITKVIKWTVTVICHSLISQQKCYCQCNHGLFTAITTGWLCFHDRIVTCCCLRKFSNYSCNLTASCYKWDGTSSVLSLMAIGDFSDHKRVTRLQFRGFTLGKNCRLLSINEWLFSIVLPIKFCRTSCHFFYQYKEKSF